MIVKKCLTQTVSLKAHPLYFFFSHEIIMGLLHILMVLPVAARRFYT